MQQNDVLNRVMQLALGSFVIVGSSFWLLGFGKPPAGKNVLATEIISVRGHAAEGMRLIDRSRADQIDRQTLLHESRILRDRTSMISERVRIAWFDRHIKTSAGVALRLIDETHLQFENLATARSASSLIEIRKKLNVVFSDLNRLELELGSNGYESQARLQ